MSLKKNIISNYAGTLTSTILSFLVVPFYIKWLDPEAYGLVGIASLVQGWVMLLNAGLTPVVGHQAARAHGGAADWNETGRLFRTIDWLMAGLSLLVFLGIVFTGPWLANNWLEKTHLETKTVSTSLILLVLMALTRLLSSVSRGVIANMEAQLWLNANLAFFNALRFAASLPIVYTWRNIEVLFSWWTIIALIEYFSIQRKVNNLIPISIPLFTFDLIELKKHGQIITSLTFTSTVWILLTQLDKLILSGILSLERYGHYSIAILLASGILILAQPVSQAFQPRMTKAFSQGGVKLVTEELILCTQLLVLLIAPIGAVIFAMPESVVYIWTGDYAVSTNVANVLRGYVIGNTLIAIGGLLYLMQLAIGNIRWHLRGNLIFAIILIPTVPWIAKQYGAEGAGWLWAGINLLLFLGWNSFLLSKLAPAIRARWLWRDTLTPLATAFFSAWLVTKLIQPEHPSRLYLSILALLVMATSTLALLIIMPEIRQRVKCKIFSY